MWQVLNRTPFAAAGAFERDRDGREAWAIVVRAAFDLGEGGAALRRAEVQPEVRRVPVMGGPDNAVMIADTDFVAFLPGSDILMRGTVRPARKDSDTLPVALTLGAVTVAAVIHGPRIAQRGWFGWSVTEAAPVGDTALDWTLAWGGKGPNSRVPGVRENPVGMGFDLSDKVETTRGARVALPQILSPGDDVLAAPDRLRPRGFGAVARSWEPRLTHAGTYDAAWSADRAPLLPRDFDPRFYHAAPPDLCMPAPLKGGEAVSLDGFLPAGPFTFRLPQAVMVARTVLGRDRIETPFRVTKVEIDIDAMTLGMVWIATVPCNGRDGELQSSQVELRQITGMRT